MWASSGIVLKRGASRSRSALADFITNRRGVSGLLSDPTAIAASPSSSGPFLYSNRRGQAHHFSNFADANGKRPFLIDTSDLVKRMEAQEVPPKQAEVIAEFLKDGLGSVTQSYPWKGGMEKEHIFSIMQRVTEKLGGDVEKIHIELRSDFQAANEKIRGDTEKMLSELWGDTKKMLTDLRVGNEKMLGDLLVGNEKLHGELRVEREKVTRESTKMYSELRVDLEKLSCDSRKLNDELRVLLKDAKYTALKFFIGILVSVAGVGLGVCFAVIRIMMFYTNRVEAGKGKGKGKGMERRE